LPRQADRLRDIVRKHWSIENELHRVLDVALHEDQAPENFAVLCHNGLKLLKQERTAKGGMYGKLLQAAWREDYLLKVLAAS
jgi:predicted transposase YbfD/YdcC